MENISNYDGPALIGPTGEPRDFEASFETAAGPQLLRGELLGSMPTTGYMPQGATIGAEPAGHVAVDGPARWTWDGETGYGWAQRTWIRGGWDEVRERDRRRVRASRLA